MLKGAPVSTEATAIPGASATTEVQNNSAEAQYNSASASDPVDAEAPAKILIPLEHCGTDGIRTQSIPRNGDDAMMMQPQNAHGRSKEQAVDHKSKIGYLVKHATLNKSGSMGSYHMWQQHMT